MKNAPFDQEKVIIGQVGSTAASAADYTGTIFKEWYMSLDRKRNLHTTAREIIMDACGISIDTFYNWIGDRVVIPMLARYQINQIAGETVFRVKIPDPEKLSQIRSIWQQRENSPVAAG